MIFNRWCSARSLFTGGSSAHLCLLNFYNLSNIRASAEYQSSLRDTMLVLEPLIRSNCHRLHIILKDKNVQITCLWPDVHVWRPSGWWWSYRREGCQHFTETSGQKQNIFWSGCVFGDQNKYFSLKNDPFLILNKLLLCLNLIRPQA